MSFASVRNKINVMVGAAFLFSGCTFDNLYDEAMDEKMSQVFVATIPDRSGQILRNRLRYLMEGHGFAQKPVYTLTINLNIRETDLGVSRKGVTTRKNQIVTATFTLKHRETQRKVYSSKATVENPYIIQKSQFYANPVTENHVAEQSIELLAQLIKTDLAIYFRKNENQL